MISMPTKSGCFLFKREILHEMPWLCSCLALAHWSFQIFTFTQEQWGLNSDGMSWITSKGTSSPHHSLWKMVGLVLHIFRPSHFITILPALPTSFWILQDGCTRSKADNFSAINYHAGEIMYYRSSTGVDSVKKNLSYLVPTGNFPPVLLKWVLGLLGGETGLHMHFAIHCTNKTIIHIWTSNSLKVCVTYKISGFCLITLFCTCCSHAVSIWMKISLFAEKSQSCKANILHQHPSFPFFKSGK